MNASELTITLGKSPLYFRLTLFIYAIVGYLLMMSSIVFLGKCLGVILMVGQVKSIFKYRKPQPFIIQIACIHQAWTVTGKKKSKFEDIKQLINAGFFQLLVLSNGFGRQQWLVIFRDQLSEADYHQLQLVLNVELS